MPLAGLLSELQLTALSHKLAFCLGVEPALSRIAHRPAEPCVAEISGGKGGEGNYYFCQRIWEQKYAHPPTAELE
jgi:hypothetical protein